MEAENGAIIRKGMAFAHIAAQHAEAVDRFHRQDLNPYINFHRPCAIADIVEAPNGKRRRLYRRWATPFEIFGQTLQCESYRRLRVNMAELVDSPKRNPKPKPPSRCNRPNGNC